MLHFRYSSETGEFTVPPEGAGLFFFLFHFIMEPGEFADFGIRRNGQWLCLAAEDENAGGDKAGASCGVVVTLEEGTVFEKFL